MNTPRKQRALHGDVIGAETSEQVESLPRQHRTRHGSSFGVRRQRGWWGNPSIDEKPNAQAHERGTETSNAARARMGWAPEEFPSQNACRKCRHRLPRGHRKSERQKSPGVATSEVQVHSCNRKR